MVGKEWLCTVLAGTDEELKSVFMQCYYGVYLYYSLQSMSSLWKDSHRVQDMLKLQSMVVQSWSNQERYSTRKAVASKLSRTKQRGAPVELHCMPNQLLDEISGATPCFALKS